MSDEEMEAASAGVTVGTRRGTASTGPEVTEVPLELAGTRVTRRVRSFKEIRQQGVVLQALDYSCGAAALATMVTYFFQKPTKEEEVIATILVSGQTPQEGLRKYFRRKGFTLLDLKRAAEAKGYRGSGYRGMTLDDLVETLRDERSPILVAIKPFGYYHFVVVRGIQGDRVFLADPAVGNTTMKLAVFESVWVEGIGFVVTRPNQRASRPGPMLASADGAGGIVLSQADPSRGPSQGSAEPRRGNGDGVPPLLEVKPEQPVPNPSWLMPVIDRMTPPIPSSGPDQNFYNEIGRRVVSFFALPNYNPAVQFGYPAGNFVDFSPPRGQSITSSPTSQ
jgi:predicted double-glycine peptidase